MKIAYGYEGITEDNHLIDTAVKAMEVFCLAARPGFWLVDNSPMCDSYTARVRAACPTMLTVRYVPSWFLGAKFKQLAKQWSKTVLYAISHPFEELKRYMAGQISRYLVLLMHLS